MTLAIVYLILIVVCLSPGSVIIASGHVQTTDVQVLERGDDWQCPSMEEREGARNEIRQIAYLVMSSICRGPGWRRVAFINMTNTSYNCPTGLNLTSYSKRTCGRSHTIQKGCSSTTFSVGGLPYSRVCGRIRGYQFGISFAFQGSTEGIDSDYTGGISLTHGGTGNRQHIWTFAAGITEVATPWPSGGCPCDTGNYARVPAFVGDDYFCESGLHSAWNYTHYILFSDDVLWDGEDCTSTSTCCQINNPPWFTKNLTNATTDDIELRLCTRFSPQYNDVPIELIELYVQ